MPFPLPFRPRPDYHPSGAHARYFGAARPNGRRHAGCDLIAPRGTPVFAIDDETVEEYVVAFYHGTSAVAVQHGAFLVRYCEVSPQSIASLRPGAQVKAGQQIASVGGMLHSSMLHFELYSGTKKGPLTMMSNRPISAGRICSTRRLCSTISPAFSTCATDR